MRTYAQFRPTAFDSAGAFLPDRRDWLVAPIIQTRDSEALSRSNFEVVSKEIEALDPDGESWEIHRFGHWGPGWFEILIVRPGTPAADRAAEWERRLADYPIADETHFSELEWTEATEYWTRMPLRDRVELCQFGGVSVFAARRDEIPQDDCGRIYERLIAV